MQLKKTVNYEKCNYNLSVPNVFTPNGDGLNDIFKVLFNIPPAQFSLSIYNRHGMKYLQVPIRLRDGMVPSKDLLNLWTPMCGQFIILIEAESVP